MRSCPCCRLTRRTILAALFATAATGSVGRRPVSEGSSASVTPPTPTPPPTTVPGPEQVAKRATVPVLCYHQFREWTPKDSKYDRELLIIPPANFLAQLDAIKADGWNAISPDDYHQHLRTDRPLPPKPFMVTLDDGTIGQYQFAIPELLKRGMHPVAFPMTVVINKPGWCSDADIKAAAAQGVTIGVHTYNHGRVDKYKDKDWAAQLEQPRARLQQLSGQPVEYFAYPNGAWNPPALPHLDQAGFKAAYQLMDHPLDPTKPELTLRRQLAVSTWTGPQVVAKLQALSTAP